MPDKIDPAANAYEVTPSDVDDLDPRPRALYIGTEGDLAVRFGADEVSFVAVSGLLPIRPTRVLATGTTADDIVALY